MGLGTGTLTGQAPWKHGARGAKLYDAIHGAAILWQAGKRAGFWVWVMAVLAVVVAVASYRYLLPGMPGGAPPIVANRFNHFGALIAHAGLSATAFILGALQFFPKIRARWPAWHRRAGTTYVARCMVGGGVAFVLALGATSGPVGSAGFGLLAIFWLTATANAWRLARARDFVRHERWMMRSYALTFAAVTLRLDLPLIPLAHVDFVTGYRTTRSWPGFPT